MASSVHKPPIQFKFILIGDTEVGKSTLMLMYLEKQFIPSHEVTIGVEFGSKLLSMKGKSVKLEIWDTAGQEAYLSITRAYYRNSHGCLLVYDVTRRESFEHCARWLDEARNHSGNDRLAIMLVGNKSDMESKRKVPKFEAEEFAADKGIDFVEVSAKDYQLVHQAFLIPTAKIFKEYEADPERFLQDSTKFNVKSTSDSGSSTTCC